MSARFNSYYNNHFYEKYNINRLPEKERIKAKKIIDKTLEKMREQEIEENRKQLLEMQAVLSILFSNQSPERKKQELRGLNVSGDYAISLKKLSINSINKKKEKEEKTKKPIIKGILSMPIIELLDIGKNLKKFVKKISKSNKKIILNNKKVQNTKIKNTQKDFKISIPQNKKVLDIIIPNSTSKQNKEIKKISCLKDISLGSIESNNHQNSKNLNLFQNSKKVNFVKQLSEQKNNPNVNSKDVGRVMERPNQYPPYPPLPDNKH